MHHSSFEYVPREDIQSFVSQQHETLPNRTPPEPTTLRTPEEILATASVPETPPPRQVVVDQCAPKRIYVRTTATQRQVLTREYAEHGETKPLSYYHERTRIAYPTLRRLVKSLKWEKTSQSRESVEESQSTRPNCSNPSHPSCARKTRLSGKPRKRFTKQTSRLLGLKENPSPTFPSRRSTVMSEMKPR